MSTLIFWYNVASVKLILILILILSANQQQQLYKHKHNWPKRRGLTALWLGSTQSQKNSNSHSPPVSPNQLKFWIPVNVDLNFQIYVIEFSPRSPNLTFRFSRLFHHIFATASSTNWSNSATGVNMYRKEPCIDKKFDSHLAHKLNFWGILQMYFETLRFAGVHG